MTGLQAPAQRAAAGHCKLLKLLNKKREELFHGKLLFSNSKKNRRTIRTKLDFLTDLKILQMKTKISPKRLNLT
jgi:hypothetical protein